MGFSEMGLPVRGVLLLEEHGDAPILSEKSVSSRKPLHIPPML
jgi:hypothetical protein